MSNVDDIIPGSNTVLEDISELKNSTGRSQTKTKKFVTNVDLKRAALIKAKSVQYDVVDSVSNIHESSY